jgi:hypothetical protein
MYSHLEPYIIIILVLTKIKNQTGIRKHQKQDKVVALGRNRKRQRRAYREKMLKM